MRPTETCHPLRIALTKFTPNIKPVLPLFTQVLFFTRDNQLSVTSRSYNVFKVFSKLKVSQITRVRCKFSQLVVLLIQIDSARINNRLKMRKKAN